VVEGSNQEKSGFYTRKDRLVQSLDALKKRLGDCSHTAKKEFSAIETQNIIKYLNDQFYQFRSASQPMLGSERGVHRPDPKIAPRE